jgi:hypothetical protein
MSKAAGTVEIRGQSDKIRVVCSTTHQELPPGDSDVATVNLPGAMQQPWRFTIFYHNVSVPGRFPKAATTEWINDK